MNAPTNTIALPTVADVDAAAARIKGVAIRTPLVPKPSLLGASDWRRGEELDLDDLKELTGIDAAELLARLLEWELAGHVMRTPAGRFMRL